MDCDNWRHDLGSNPNNLINNQIERDEYDETVKGSVIEIPLNDVETQKMNESITTLKTLLEDSF